MRGTTNGNQQRGQSDLGRATLSGPPAGASSEAGGAPSSATGGGGGGPGKPRGPPTHGRGTGQRGRGAYPYNSKREGQQSADGKLKPPSSLVRPNNAFQRARAAHSISEDQDVAPEAIASSFKSNLGADVAFEAAGYAAMSPSIFEHDLDEFDLITSSGGGKRQMDTSGSSVNTEAGPPRKPKKRMATAPANNESGADSGPLIDPFAALNPPNKPPKRVKGKNREADLTDELYRDAASKGLKLSIHSENRRLKHDDFVLIDHALQVQMYERALRRESVPTPRRCGIRQGVMYIITEVAADLDIYENMLKNMSPPTPDTPTDYIITRGDRAPTLHRMNCKVASPFIYDHWEMFKILLNIQNPTLAGTKMIIHSKVDRPFDKANTVLRLWVDVKCMEALKNLNWRAKYNLGHVDFWDPNPKTDGGQTDPSDNATNNTGTQGNNDASNANMDTEELQL